VARPYRRFTRQLPSAAANEESSFDSKTSRGFSLAPASCPRDLFSASRYSPWTKVCACPNSPDLVQLVASYSPVRGNRKHATSNITWAPARPTYSVFDRGLDVRWGHSCACSRLGCEEPSTSTLAVSF